MSEIHNKSTNIRQLNPDLFNVVVTGLILYRSPSRTAKILNLLLRDSKDSSIVCVVWGPQSYIQELWDKCEFGKTVTVSYARVTSSTNEFHPWTTSPFIITASDRSQITFACDNNNSNIHDLLYSPYKPIERALHLDDIRINGEKGIGQYVDVCVLFRQLKPTKHIKLKDGRVKSLRECVLCDKTNAGMLLTMWSEDFIARSDKWQPLNQVLHMMDVKVGYSLFYKSIYLITTSKTVIAESPAHRMAQELLDYGLQMNPFQSTVDGGGNSLVPLATEITEVMTCQRLLDRMSSKEGTGDEDQFTGVIYAVLTRFNIDEEHQRGIKTKW